MENASKALIIAGAILLSILIIGLGMFIYNGASETLDKTASRMNEQEKQTHNQRFQKFAGERKSGSDVKSLINEMSQNYSTQVQNGELMRVPETIYTPAQGNKITIEGGKEISDNQFNLMMNDIKTTRSYTVKVDLDPKSGIVNKIEITEIK